MSLTSADTLSEALATTPPVRAEQVERARQLVLDASYPPEVLINKISALFAGHLGPKDPTQDEDANPASEAAQ